MKFTFFNIIKSIDFTGSSKPEYTSVSVVSDSSCQETVNRDNWANYTM